MADLLNLVKGADLVDFAEGLNYKTTFVGNTLFPTKKTKNILVEARNLVANGDLPVMAQVHAYDAEARIGDRTNFTELKAEKLFIKERLNRTERMSILLGDNLDNADKKDVIRFIYDDANNLVSRVLTRCEVANMEVLATGKLTIKENNANITVDYNLPSANAIDFESWSDKTHSILSDLETIRTLAKANGKTIDKALTSTKVIGYMKANDEIKAYFAGTGLVPTERRILQFVFDEYGIAFVTNDDVYKTSANASETKRFYPENKITFFGGNGALGQGLFGVTPEERENVGYSEKANVMLTQWKTEDPVAVWTKASACYLPVIKDINGIFIATLV